MKTAITEELVERLLHLLSFGLVQGLGDPKPGKMCVEAAVCYAMGEPHGDRPSCVDIYVRRAKIRLNDRRWTSHKARGDGMRRVAVAQLGSKQVFDPLKEPRPYNFGLEFEKRMNARYNAKYPNRVICWERDEWAEHLALNEKSDRPLVELADMMADVLAEMGTEGSKYLEMVK